MTRWQFDDGSTVANGTSNVTYQVPSLSSEHTGVYYCEAIIDSMMDTSLSYTLFGEYVFRSCFQCLSVCLSVCHIYHCKSHMGQQFSGIPNLVNSVTLLLLAILNAFTMPSHGSGDISCRKCVCSIAVTVYLPSLSCLLFMIIGKDT